ncbi:MAG: capsid cement protein [Pseudomonadota bacterium]
MIPKLIISFEAAALIEGYRILAFANAGADTTVSHAAANTDAFAGVSDKMGAAVGGMCDVHRAGIGEVQLGGAVSAGDPLTADANGKAIVAAPAAATVVRIIGFADAPGVADDIISFLHAPGVINQG